MKLEGRCFCGACSWASDAEPNWVCICHCSSCRRNCAAPFTTFFGINNTGWRWTGKRPATLQSSAGVTRFFCGSCGTPMAYRNAKWDHEVHFYVASLADPDQLSPQFHVHWDERLAWVSIADDLPRYAASADGNEPL